MSLLEIKDLHAGYGQMSILKGVNMTLDEGEIGVIVGPNGAGKSTTLKAIFGMLNITGGSIGFDGADITGIRSEKLADHRIAFVPQEHNVFPTLTVHENLEMGAYVRRDDFSAVMDHVYDIFPPLKEKRQQAAGELSGGQRQMVAFGRALMIEPKLILLDEPTAGLSPMFMSQIFDRVIAINRTGVTVAMVEQNAKQALAIAHKGFVLAGGQNSYTDTGRNLLNNPEVAASFLGG
ncbi:ABC transporter ATP-binding protein [Hoeflea prorocentri]|uniref:ABC transporter ATP-binding protein n=1 Tax=Hoeflea prorocentri TaxID=1922333 RepID=A0A9X3UKF8_9HYPH|nr:ABC transporter ATP-binding protein [Hoeflea prorocentri]MCY6382055.1 ABC transporter ATP-binding protein [Hoeflea prorocentri]MDA5399855.1 ABC transporter ATP-binding protein [Hoeflea prorocentri]